MSWDCFISYASADVKHAELVHQRLTAAGLTVWFDRARLNPGCQWHQEIEAGCEDSRIMLPLLTPRWKQSLWTRFETYGHDCAVPLWFEGALAEVFTPPLRRFQADTIDLSHADDHDWLRLIDSIRALLAKPAPQKAQRLVRMRYGHTPHFVGREDKLSEIHEKLWTNPTAALTQGHVQAVTALGGVGKTTLAREYAERFWRLYPQAFWVDCRLDLESEFAAVFDLLFPDRAHYDLKPGEKARQAMAELNQSPDRPMRLLVLDDGLDQDAVAAWIPHAGRCHTLITSRFTAWSGDVANCPVWILDPQAARLLLLGRSLRDWEQMNAAERAAVETLAEKLGFLPLALEQAAAYIAKQPGYTFKQYLDELREDEKTPLDRRTPGSTDYPASVYRTWRKTIEKLPAGARAMLRLSAFLASTPIPFEMFSKSPEILAERVAAIDPAEADSAHPPSTAKIRDWRVALTDYSMARAEADDAFSVHGLVQAVERHGVPSAEVPKWIESVRAMLCAYAPEDSAEDPKTWPIWNLLLPHAELLVEAADHDRRVAPHLALLVSLGQLYFGKGRYKENLGVDERALRIAEALHGPVGCEMADRLLAYGETVRVLGRDADAEAACRKTLAIRETLHGPDSLEVASVLNYVAIVCADQGRTVEAESLQRRALAIYKSHPTPEDRSDLAKTLNNLAELLKAREDFANAEPMYREAIEIQERLLGPQHPATLCTVNNLATMFASNGDCESAEPLFARTLATCEQVLGPDHPHSIASRHNLGGLLERKGDYASAELLYRQALQDFERVLGLDHRKTINCVSSLAGTLTARGDNATAESLYRRTLLGRERLLGSEHPDTLASAAHLAALLKAKGDYAAAEPFCHRVLEAEKRCGRDNEPQFALELNNYALLLRQLGRYDEAAGYLRRAIAIEDLSLPSDHPKRAHRRNNLAIVCILAGMLDQAAAASTEAWQLKSGRHDLTSGRILVGRVALSRLRHQDGALYLGQLKTLVSTPDLPCLGDIDRKWNTTDILENLRSKLPGDAIELLTALIEALNAPSTLPALERFAAWQAVAAVPLDTPWPADPAMVAPNTESTADKHSATSLRSADNQTIWMPHFSRPV